MPRDYTDYVAQVWGAGDRVFFLEHFRQLKHDPVVDSFEFNGREYILNKDRAFKVKWAPWKKWDWRRFVWSVNEFFRTRKIGLVVYREPNAEEPQYKTVAHKVPRQYVCKKCGYETNKPRSIKIHVSNKHNTKDYGAHIKIRFDTQTEKVEYYPPVEPYHISKMHQPSGRMPLNGEVVNEEPDSLLSIITPRLLKVEVEDDTYKKAYKSYKFGNIVPITQKWYIWVIVAIVTVFVILFLTGNFSVGGP